MPWPRRWEWSLDMISQSIWIIIVSLQWFYNWIFETTFFVHRNPWLGQGATAWSRIAPEVALRWKLFIFRFPVTSIALDVWFALIYNIHSDLKQPQKKYEVCWDTIRMASWNTGDARILSIVVVFFAGAPGDGPRWLSFMGASGGRESLVSWVDVSKRTVFLSSMGYSIQ